MTHKPESTEAIAAGQRAALYVRTSTADQHVENQRADLLRVAKQRGFYVVGLYEERLSAAKQRPALDRMLLDAHAGLFDYLLIWAIDRIGRSMAGNLSLILELDRTGVTVLSAREPWLDTASTVRPLLIGIFSWVAEQERMRIAERTRAGLARARAKGIRVGRPPAQVEVEELRALRAAGRSYREIGRTLGIGASTAHRLLAADETLLRAVPKSGACRMDSKTSEPLVAEPCFATDRFENDDGEG